MQAGGLKAAAAGFAGGVGRSIQDRQGFKPGLGCPEQGGIEVAPPASLGEFGKPCGAKAARFRVVAEQLLEIFGGFKVSQGWVKPCSFCEKSKDCAFLAGLEGASEEAFEARPCVAKMLHAREEGLRPESWHFVELRLESGHFDEQLEGDRGMAHRVVQHGKIPGLWKRRKGAVHCPHEGAGLDGKHGRFAREWVKAQKLVPLSEAKLFGDAAREQKRMRRILGVQAPESGG